MIKPDDYAIFAFLTRQKAVGKVLLSEGGALRRRFMERGAPLAVWSGEGVVLPSGGSKLVLRLQDKILDAAAKLGVPTAADAAPASFTAWRDAQTPKGRAISYGPLEWANAPRFPDDTIWSKMHPVYVGETLAGSIFYSPMYGMPCTFHGSLTQLRWTVPGFASAPAGTRSGYDTGPSKTLDEALVRWGRSADEILDWGEANIQPAPARA